MREDRLEEILKLQTEVIRSMTQKNLGQLGDDLWGPRVETEPPRGYPKVPDVFGVNQNEPGKTEQAGKPRGKQEEQAPAAPPKENIEDLQKELHSYIGLDNIKTEVESLINLVRVNLLRKQNELPNEELSLHMVFSGNPGTGKTMVARLMSRIYHALGLLSKGHLVEVDRSGLVAGYVGQTAIKTSDVIKKAMGGVLFIDEAYALTTRGPMDYGQEAVETLLKAMEDHRDDLIVIVAGYTDLMEEFLDSNPGLESRFNRRMHFLDYTPEEMLDIFDMRANKAGYRVEEGAREALLDALTQKSKDAEFGNARGVRNLFEVAVMRQANRLAKEKDISRDMLMRLTAEDILGA